jgi:predicted nucleic acid-binding protein
LTTLVLDASILVKLFRDEADSPLARAAVIRCAEHRIVHVAPDLALYEVLSVALHYGISFDIPVRLITDLRKAGFQLIEPSAEELKKAEAIATMKTPAYGFPQLKDSIYHAMAIMRGGTFLTADRRHFERTRELGGIQLLADWRPA